MLKNILKLEGAQKLSKNEQKEISGGKNIEGDCRCFCYSGTIKVSNSCFSYCPNGTIPGLYEGSTGNCTFPENLGGL